MMVFLLAFLGCSEQMPSDFRDAPSYNRCLVLKEEAPEDCHEMGRAALAAGDLGMARMGLSIACRTGVDAACSRAPELLAKGAPPMEAALVVSSGCFKRSSAVACSTYLELVEGHPDIGTSDLIEQAKRIAGTNDPASNNPKAPEKQSGVSATTGTAPEQAPTKAGR